MFRTTPHPDRPIQTARRDDKSRDEFQHGLRMMREGAVVAAKALRRLQESGHCVFEGCAGIGELGERLGASAAETRQLLALGRVLEVCPPVEAHVREGRVPVPAAALLDEVLSHPERLREGDDWVHLAQTLTTKTLRRAIEQRVRESTPGEEPPVFVSVLVSAKVCDDFVRARTLASRKAERVLTDGETLEAVLDHYLDSFDPTRTKDRARRTPHTSEVPGRHVPATEQRKVMARDGDACAIPFCDNVVFLENAHIHPHAEGGHREADNLLRLCSKHHRQFDEGKIRLVGTADRPSFFDAHGRPLDVRRGAVENPAANSRPADLPPPSRSEKVGPTAASPPSAGPTKDPPAAPG